MIHDTQSAQISQKQDEYNIYVIYVIMKTMCPPSYLHSSFVATHALGHMMYGYICYHENNVLSRLSPQWLCGDLCTWTYDVSPQWLCGNSYLNA